ncbi:hypothetical protein P154DRAFT_520426 [Amniculicola lignicola CBS 123094]|uniref:Uncharacterized protein n=1 Tax=Amniculicola lignicola CBS 123094 TaxID=1392246 RepID=A0A6A5WVG6_9PLEO|nr:hypothetical protein P154DRAFT_520426 [Amniculicola lignicola CBS 123094]
MECMTYGTTEVHVYVYVHPIKPRTHNQTTTPPIPTPSITPPSQPSNPHPRKNSPPFPPSHRPG